MHEKHFEEEYNIYDADYVKWLMANHHNVITFTKWVKKPSSTVPTSTASLHLNKSTKSSKITVNYKSVYIALDWLRKGH